MTSEYETSKPTRNGDLDGRSLEDMVERIVESKMSKYTSELDQKIDLAAEKITRHNQERHLYVKQAVKDALFGMEHVLSAAYVPLKPDYWELYVIYDGDCLADFARQLIAKISKVEDLPSVPLLDPKIIHVSESTEMPDDSTMIFDKR